MLEHAAGGGVNLMQATSKGTLEHHERRLAVEERSVPAGHLNRTMKDAQP